MALVGAVEKRVTRHRNEYPQVLQYANENRKEGSFVDVTVAVGNINIPANRLILSCCSKVFEKMFKTQMKERYEPVVNITADVDVNAIKMIIEFIYTGSIAIDNENVMQLLEAADYLQLDEIKQFCAEFLESILTPDSCFSIFEVAFLYNIVSLQNRVFRMISSKFDEFIETDMFVELAKNDLIACISQLNRNQVKEVTVYDAIVTWTRADESSRKKEFSELLPLVHLDKLPHQFLIDVVSTEALIKENLVSTNLVLRSVCNILGKSKIISFGGWLTLGRAIEVYRYSYGIKTETIRSDLPIDLNCGQTLKVQDHIYCIGGSTRKNPPHYYATPTNKVLRLKDLQNPIMEWAAAMNEKRSNFGAAVFSDCLVVTGGYNGKQTLSSSECYIPGQNKWKKIATTKQPKSGNALVTCKGCLYDIGGSDRSNRFSSVQRLRALDEEWTSVQALQVERRNHAAVTLNGHIYAMGGKPITGETLDSVERYDPISNQWVNVHKLNIPRSGHAACILRNKIFVVGGVTGNNEFVKEIESYDPDVDTWYILGQSEGELKDHSLIVV